jgi:signal transduction histidine kinase
VLPSNPEKISVPIGDGTSVGKPLKDNRVRFLVTPPHWFAIVSLLLIVVAAIVTSMTQSSFYRQAIIQREAAIIHDMVQALVSREQHERELTLEDLKHFEGPGAQARLEHAFGTLTNVLAEVRIKVFNRDGRIAWSDEPRLTGTSVTRNPGDLSRALNGEVRAVLDPVESLNNPLEGLPDHSSLIEVYTPFSMAGPPGSSLPVAGVVALYRYPMQLNETIHKGLILLWAVEGIGGLILFGALYQLFRSVYYAKREAESQFAKLSAEHARLMQIERLSALGQMVSEIAHQLNNPLVGVINLAELAEREIDKPARVRELLGEVRKAGSLCRDFVQRVLRLSKVNRSEPAPTDINALVKETIAFFQQSLGGRPSIAFQPLPGPRTINADPVLLRNALFNVIHNAALADSKGPVSVALQNEQRGGVPGCSIIVSDSGPGLTPEVASKLFVPFFTTRPGGTGLGLSISQHIAVQHGGMITAHNNPDRGARFVMWLPLVNPRDDAQNPARR